MDTINQVSSKVARRTRAALNKLVQSRQLSQSGLNWLITATDPFHDTEIECSGYPDVASSRSICQVVTKTETFEPAADISGDADMTLFFLPLSPIMWGTEKGYYQASTDLSGSISAFRGEPFSGGFNVVSHPAGTSWTDGSAVVHTSVAFPNQFSTGQWRLLSAGVEVVNISPVVNQGGSVTCYRVPSFPCPGQVYGDDVTSQPAPMRWGTMPPLNLEEAALYPNSRTWAAADGLYMTAALNTVDNPYVSTVPGQAGLRRIPTYLQLTNNTVMPSMIAGHKTGSPLAINFNEFASASLLPWDISGAIFSGLTPETKFQITTRYYYERVPTAEDQNLLVLTKTPPHYDPLVLEIYSHAMGLLPTAVPVGENPLGEWFDTVMDVVSGALPLLGTAIAPVFPPASAIAAGAAAGAQAVKDWNRQNREAEARSRAQVRAKKPLPVPPKKVMSPSPSTTTVTVTTKPPARKKER